MVPDAIKRSLEKEPSGAGDDLVVEVITISDQGWPHGAMISWGELAVLSPDRLRMALWARSDTTRFLAETGKATLFAVAEGAHHALRVTVDGHSEAEIAAGELRRVFDLSVVGSTSKEAPYAELVSGASFRLNDPAPTIERWRQMRFWLEGEG